MNTKLKFVLLSLLVIVVSFGLFIVVRTQYLTYTRAKQFHQLLMASSFASSNSVSQLYGFIGVEFPDQVKDYTAKLQAQAASTKK